ncbi:MAG: hypothetical protein V4612_01830 [Pseudomonadota bacterium]
MLLERIYRHKKTLLKLVLENFKSQNLQPKIGVELEFYLLYNSQPASPKLIHEFTLDLQSTILKHNIDLLAIEPEQGCGQIEIKTLPYLDIPKLCADIEKIKDLTRNLNPNFQVNFASQPYQNDCGNSLQINFSLMQGDNFLFAKDDQQESQYLLQAINGTLKFTKDMMIICAPEPEDYLRFDLKLNRNLHKQQKYTAPVNISWGYNNRTTLVRIPATQKITERRLEFRAPANSADLYLISAFFLLAVLRGIKLPEKFPGKIPGEVYGNSFDEQYDLENLPNYEQAKEYFWQGNLANEILFILDSNRLD